MTDYWLTTKRIEGNCEDRPIHYKKESQEGDDDKNWDHKHNLNKEESDLRAFTNNKKQSEYKY